VIYFIAVALIKTPFLCFGLRIVPRKELETKVFVLVAISVAYSPAFTLTSTFKCTPISYIWEDWDGEHIKTCIIFHIFACVHAAINIALDALIIAIPIPELMRLSMSMKKKIQIISMFNVGTL
jgi:hypothetical protein